MFPPSLVSIVQAVVDVVMESILLGQHQYPAHLTIVTDHVYPFMTTMYQLSGGYFQQDVP